MRKVAQERYAGSLKALVAVAIVLSLIAIAVTAVAFHSLSCSIENVASGINEVSGKLGDLEKRVGDLQSSSSGLAQQIQAVSSKYGSVAEELKSLEKRIEGLQSNSSKLAYQIKTIGEKYSSVAEELKCLEQELSRLKNEVGALRNEVVFPLQVTDSLNRIVMIPREPERIVSIAPSITEILFMIGAGDKVVGIDAFSNYPPIIEEMKKNGSIAVVGGFSTISIDKVVALKPDLVVGVGGIQAKTLYTLSQLGITTLCLNDETVSDIVNDILLLGRITSHTNEALNLASQIRENLTQLYSVVRQKNESVPTILYVVWTNPVYAAGGSSWVNDLIEIAGAKNALSNTTTAWPMIGWEQVVALNPDIIIFTEHAGGLTNAKQALEWLKSQPYGSDLKAVKTSRIYMVHGELNDIACRPGPRVYYLALTLAVISHPSAFDLTSVPNDLYLANITSINISG